MTVEVVVASAAVEDVVAGTVACTPAVAIDMFGGLSEHDREMVTAKLISRTFGRNEILFLQGDPGDSVHIIERGRVAVRTSTPDGDEVTLAVLGAGDFFGEQALITDEARRTASVVALDSVETRMLHRRDFDDLCRARPSVQGFLVRMLAGQVRRLSEQMLEMLYVPVEDRVVRSLAGTTRPTANRVLKRLESDGVITLHRSRTTIVDPEALRAM